MWDLTEQFLIIAYLFTLILSVPDHCLSFYFKVANKWQFGSSLSSQYMLYLFVIMHIMFISKIDAQRGMVCRARV